MENFYEALFQGLLQRENQRWISVNLHNMIPIEDELFKKIKGFIITGSHHDAYDVSMPWVPFSYDIFNKIIYPKEDNVIQQMGMQFINMNLLIKQNYVFRFNDVERLILLLLELTIASNMLGPSSNRTRMWREGFKDAS